MRAGEFTCPLKEAFQSDMLSPGDMCVDSHDNSTRLGVHLKRSKTEQDRLSALPRGGGHVKLPCP